MSNGRNCDNCETHLNDEDYVSFGSWSYTCPECGFLYRHGSAGVSEQVERFNSRPTKHALDLPVCTCTTVENKPHVEPDCPRHGNSASQ